MPITGFVPEDFRVSVFYNHESLHCKDLNFNVAMVM